LRIFSTHLADCGKGLERAIASYNNAIGSFESRVMVSARRFRELGAGTGDEVEMLEPVTAVAREVNGTSVVGLRSSNAGRPASLASDEAVEDRRQKTDDA
jgi:DNA recombination protein RmuC